METALQQLQRRIAEESENKTLTAFDIIGIIQSLIPAEQEQYEVKFEEGYKQACIDNEIQPDDDVLFEHIKDLRQTYQSK